MAQRRMFSKKITDTDTFLDMPMSTQCLYFHLNMNADDEGFIGNAKTIKRMIGASDDDLKLLMTKEFLIPFESGVVVIKDWKIHNYIQKDRYQKTVYNNEKKQIAIDENGSYTKCIQDVSNLDTQDRLGKDRLGKDIKYIVGQDPTPPINSDTDLDKKRKLDDLSEKASVIVDYLNQKTGTKYKASSQKTKKHISARLGEGFSVDDFKKVIDIKTAEWLNDTNMRKYLRPETLFGTKFESYLNQLVRKDGSNAGNKQFNYELPEASTNDFPF
ncbi:DNA replication protein [Listeria monocytogenes]|nr:DNA replication protein [Listeria monocytogenes]EDN9846528.1 DNA replication protein [Listeria monocytogenes]